jgi:tetratricopeptide (TPR) repeat protein
MRELPFGTVTFLFNERAGDLGKLPAAFTQLGHVTMYEGNPALAVTLYERVLEHESTDPWCTPAVAFCNLGFALLECGKIEEAKRNWKRGLAHAREDGSSLTTVALLLNLASAALVERDLDACAPLLRESCELLRTVPDPQLITEALDLCACLAAARNAPLAAARLGGAASAQRSKLGVTQVELEVDARRELLDGARAAAGREWNREWGVGEELAPAAALEEALETLDSTSPRSLQPLLASGKIVGRRLVLSIYASSLSRRTTREGAA